MLESQVSIQEVDPEIRVIRGSSTAVSMFLGIAERGPIGEPTLVLDLNHFTRIFGGHRANTTLRTAVEAHFGEGGGPCYIGRTCHYSDITDPTSYTAVIAEVSIANATSAQTKGDLTGTEVGPFDLEPGDTLVISPNGGADQTVTFAAASAKRATTGAGPYALADGDTLTYTVGGVAKPTITLATADFVDIGAATALEVANALNKGLQSARAYVNADDGVTIETMQRGSGAALQVTGGTAADAGKLNISSGAVSGTGDAANIDAITATEAVAKINSATTLITASVVSNHIKIETDTAGSSGSVQVKSSSTADTIFGLDNSVHTGANSASAVNTLKVKAKYPGAWGNDLSVTISTASNGSSLYFDMKVYQSAKLLESWFNLSMSDSDANYVETIINSTSAGSKYITVVDLDSSNSAPADRPGNASYTLASGNDGLSSLADTDFVGNVGEPNGTGLHIFDTVLDGTILVVPDRSSVQAVSTAMLAYAEANRLFTIIDPPAGLNASEAKTDLTTRGLSNVSEYAAYYWPRVTVLNPNTTVFGSGQTITIPPSGMISGLYGRVDASQGGGVYIAPAGEDIGRLKTAIGLETREVYKSAARGLVFPVRINPITKNAGGVIYVDGARTLKYNGNFPSVSERRGVLFIEKTIEAGLQTFRHRNNDARLRNQVAQSVKAFLLSQFNVSAFRGSTPDTSYQVNFGSDLNPPTEIFAGRLNGEIKLATQKPAEYIVLRFSQDLRDIQQELANAGV